ncbi:MAG: hypothetical protein WC379_16670 [Methanoregula sp.]|jgi:hypothetical protein
MKLRKLSVVLLALLLAAMAMVPIVSATEQTTSGKMVEVNPETDTQGFVAVDVINIDPAIKTATPYFGILVLSDEGKKNFLESLDAISITSGSNTLITSDNKTEIGDKLYALWKKYPVISETKKGDAGYPSYGGTITTITFAPQVRDARLTEEENEFLMQTESVINSASGQVQGNSITPKWVGSPSHQRISYWAAQKESFPFPDTVGSYSIIPDTWYDASPEPFHTLFHSLDHYYSPAGIGGAPANTQSFVATAHSKYLQGSSYYTTAAANLGYACHFIEDVGNPMHTGYETQQYSNPWVHSNYETYVGNRWYSSNFDGVVSNNNVYYYDTNWNQQTKNLAGYTNGYLDTIYMKVYNKGQNWNLAQDTSIDAVTQNVILKTTKYTNGLALYARTG